MGRRVPPCFSTADPGSFARKTLQTRKPAIIDQVVEANPLYGTEKDALLTLKREMLSGAVTDPWRSRNPETDGMDKIYERLWRQAVRPYTGKSWLDLPFYFAEALFYLRVLLASGYFCRGAPFFMVDPFEAFKRRELFELGGIERGRLILAMIGKMATVKEKLTALVYCSLWGNRIDLSLFQIAERAREKDFFERTGMVLVDHAEKLVELLKGARRTDFILDNSGQELVCDLILAFHLMSAGQRVHLHAKKYPFYVSDAQGKDAMATISALGDDSDPHLSALGKALGASLEHQRLTIHEHSFWNGPLHYPDLPREIRLELSRSDLVLLKGDVNYRRLLSDRKWEPWDRMEEIACYFPAPFAVLRTMKSDAVVDLVPERVRALEREDPEWRVNGERGMIRVVEGRGRVDLPGGADLPVSRPA